MTINILETKQSYKEELLKIRELLASGDYKKSEEQSLFARFAELTENDKVLSRIAGVPTFVEEVEEQSRKETQTKMEEFIKAEKEKREKEAVEMKDVEKEKSK